MTRLKLVIPTLAHKKIVWDFRQEFINHEEDLHGGASLVQATSFEEWYRDVINDFHEETVRPGWVPASTYLALTKDGRMVGIINVRHRLNDFLINYGGHIGYSIRRSERRKGYATEMLRLALDECRKFNLKEVLLTCDKENIGSAKTIINNGGVLENEVPEGERMTQRYWIILDEN